MLDKQAVDPLHTCLACSILQPSLRSFLIFDAPPVKLGQVAQQLVALAAEAGQKLKPQILSATSDDDLWGIRILPGRNGLLETYTQIFSSSLDSAEIPLIIIPDLASLSLAAARTCIMLVGANVAHLERHGQQEVWVPRYYWLAGCRQEDVGSVSSHLLDRFALRLAWHPVDQLALSHQERLTILQRNLQQEEQKQLPPLTPIILQQIKQTMKQLSLPKLTDEAYKGNSAYFIEDVIHTRRELALARCSLAIAQLAEDEQVQEIHVEQAANLMGLQKKAVTANLETSDPELQKIGK